MPESTPFQLLQQIDNNCRQHAPGLPSGARVEEDWIGIGFQLAGQRLIAKMSDVAEIISPPATIRVPGVQQWVTGLANVRGTLMPILDMNQFLRSMHERKAEQSRILVINKRSLVAGLQVEEVFGLRRFKPESRSTEVRNEINLLAPYLDGAFVEDRVHWNIFSIDKLVTNDQFLKVV